MEFAYNDSEEAVRRSLATTKIHTTGVGVSKDLKMNSQISLLHNSLGFDGTFETHADEVEFGE
jgi:hypothetical protein